MAASVSVAPGEEPSEEDDKLHRVRRTHAAQPRRAYIMACRCPATENSVHKLRLIVKYSLKRDGDQYLEKCKRAKERDHLQEPVIL